MPGQDQDAKGTRAFIAIDVPQELKERVKAIMDSSKGVPLKPVHDDNMHITLLFLGDLSGEEIERAKEILLALRGDSFTISLRGLGTFGGRHPRILFAEIADGADSLKRLHSSLYPKLKGAGIELEAREYSPHLTLSRIKFLRKDEAEALQEFIDDNESTEVGSFTCNEIKLKSSLIGGEKPIHEDIASVALMPWRP